MLNSLKSLWRDESGMPTAEHILWIVLGTFSCAAIVLGLVGGLRGKTGDITEDTQSMRAIETPVNTSTDYGYEASEYGKAGLPLNPTGLNEE